MSIQVKVDEVLVKYAMRYALNRSTTSTDMVVQSIEENLKVLSNEFLNRAIQEISTAMDYGLIKNEETWNELSEELKEELRRRN